MMYHVTDNHKTIFDINDSTEGETIEEKIRRVVENNEPIEDGAPLIFTERKDGVSWNTNIRTDRFELAVEGMDSVAASKLAKRKEMLSPPTETKATTNPDGVSTSD